MKLSEALTGKNNNLSVMKFLAAGLVILSHSYALTGNGNDLFAVFSGGQGDLGSLAVLVFFFFAGILILKSAERKKSAKLFFVARAVRIFPPLWVVVVLSVFLLGPLFTALPLSAYFSDPGAWKYLLNGLLVPIHNLPGVFVNNPYIATVNGPLWTLPVEFICYCACFVYYRLGLDSKTKTLVCLPLVFAAAALASRLTSAYPVVHAAIRPTLFFFLGMVCYVFRDHIPLSARGFLASCALFLASVFFRCYAVVIYLSLPYMLLYFCFGTGVKLSHFGSGWELSYGIYLVAWPVQQVLCCLIPGISVLLNFLLAWAVSIPLSFGITWLCQKAASSLRLTLR